MLTWIKRILKPPVFEGDEEKTRIARLLNSVLLVLLAIMALHIMLALFYPDPVFVLSTAGAIGLVTIVALWLMRRGYVRAAAFLLVAMLWGILVIVAVLFGGYESPALFGQIVVVVIAAMFLRGRGAFAFAILTMVFSLVLALAQENDLLPPPLDTTPPMFMWISLSIFVLTTAALQQFVTGGLREALHRARGYAAELEKQRASLEDMVAERTDDLVRRTRYLEATTVIARDAASVLDLQEQLVRVVNLVSGQFGFYHTGIFLLDPSGEWVVLQAASSEGGQRMLAHGHRLRLGVGVIGHAAELGEPRIALDVGEDAMFFDSPDLPNTRSEIALPLRARGEVIGVLDVQSAEPAAFDDEDVAVLQTLADQVAVAISNVRLFEQAQAAVAAERRAYGEMSRAAWREMLRTQLDLSFLSNREDTVLAGDLWRPEMKTALRTGETTPGDGNTNTLAIPIKVRGQIVGVVDGRKPDGRGEWTPEEVELLEALTSQLNVALEGARLYHDAQRLAARERVIGQVTGRMREPLELEAVLETAVSEIRQALGLDELVVRLTAPRPVVEEEPISPLDFWPRISEGDSV